MDTPLILPHTNGQFSLFKAPIYNVKPAGIVNLPNVHDIITSDCYKPITEHLRCITNQKESRLFKKQNFDCVTFAGVFDTRKEETLIALSGLLCMGIDCKHDIEELFQKLLRDPYFETQLLFRSASGRGVKWVIKTDTAAPFSDFALAVLRYVKQTYKVWRNGYILNPSCACYLPFDPQALINPKLR